MALLDKIKDFTATIQEEDNFSTLGNEILEDIKQLLIETIPQQTSPEEKQQSITFLWSCYLSLPDQIFDHHSQELLEVLLTSPSPSIYKVFHDSEFDLQKSINMEIEPQGIDQLILLMLIRYLGKVSAKEVILYAGGIIERKNKNVQVRLLFIELLCWAVKNVGRKEIYLPELLPLLIRLTQYGLHKYSKYKGQIDNKEYDETPSQVQEYVSHYQNWIKPLVKKVLDAVSEDAVALKGNKKSEVVFLLIRDLCEEAEVKTEKVKFCGKSKQIAHYYIIFLLDLINLVLDQRNSGLTQETINELLQECKVSLLHFHSQILTFIENYLAQIKVKQTNSILVEHNKRTPQNLLVGPYHPLSIYNTVSIAYLANQLLQSPHESILLSAEFKIKLLLPCLSELFSTQSKQSELIEETLVALNFLLDKFLLQHNSPGFISNLNKFNIPLDQILEKVLDYAGGPVDEKHKKIGLEFFSKIKKMLDEKALVRILITMITTTKNHALSGYLVTEFKSGVTNAFKSLTGGSEMQNVVSSFLDINYLKIFFDMGIAQGSSKFKDDNELIGSCVNILLLIHLKALNLVKNVENYMKLEFKDKRSLFEPTNLKIILQFGVKVFDLEKKISAQLDLYGKQIEEMQKNSANTDPNFESTAVKFNALIMVHDSITRLQEVYNELKGYIEL